MVITTLCKLPVNNNIILIGLIIVKMFNIFSTFELLLLFLLFFFTILLIIKKIERK